MAAPQNCFKQVPVRHRVLLIFQFKNKSSSFPLFLFLFVYAITSFIRFSQDLVTYFFVLDFHQDTEGSQGKRDRLCCNLCFKRFRLDLDNIERDIVATSNFEGVASLRDGVQWHGEVQVLFIIQE